MPEGKEGMIVANQQFTSSTYLSGNPITCSSLRAASRSTVHVERGTVAVISTSFSSPPVRDARTFAASFRGLSDPTAPNDTVLFSLLGSCLTGLSSSNGAPTLSTFSSLTSHIAIFAAASTGPSARVTFPSTGASSSTREMDPDRPDWPSAYCPMSLLILEAPLSLLTSDEFSPCRNFSSTMPYIVRKVSPYGNLPVPPYSRAFSGGRRRSRKSMISLLISAASIGPFRDSVAVLFSHSQAALSLPYRPITELMMSRAADPKICGSALLTSSFRDSNASAATTLTSPGRNSPPAKKPSRPPASMTNWVNVAFWMWDRAQGNTSEMLCMPPSSTEESSSRSIARSAANVNDASLAPARKVNRFVAAAAVPPPVVTLKSTVTLSCSKVSPFRNVCGPSASNASTADSVSRPRTSTLSNATDAPNSSNRTSPGVPRRTRKLEAPPSSSSASLRTDSRMSSLARRSSWPPTAWPTAVVPVSERYSLAPSMAMSINSPMTFSSSDSKKLT
mmetsp:Transcript_14409/g.27417  ORF Transcript_14409/g.27417 Transcript_14409/m.27417 type:complete len:505 (+) Transcript_14409:85-1599(+)